MRLNSDRFTLPRQTRENLVFSHFVRVKLRDRVLNSRKILSL